MKRISSLLRRRLRSMLRYPPLLQSEQWEARPRNQKL